MNNTMDEYLELCEIEGIRRKSSRMITEELVKKIVRPREAHLHKGDCGRVLIGAGTVGMAGAAILASRGALRSGAGLVRVAVPSELTTILQIAVPEATCVDRRQLLAEIGMATEVADTENSGVQRGKSATVTADAMADALTAERAVAVSSTLEQYDAICIGPGLGEGAESIAFVKAMLTSYDGVLIVDADALNIVAHNDMLGLLRDRAEHFPDTTVITPHIGEARRLLAAAVAVQASNKNQSKEMKAGTGFATASAAGTEDLNNTNEGAAAPIAAASQFDFSATATETARLDIAAALVEATRAIVVLKGSGTIVAAAGCEPLINTTGNPGMATGGSGDVLAGVITGLAGQRLQPGTGFATASTATAGTVSDTVAFAAGTERPSLQDGKPAATASRIGAYDAAVAGVYIHGLAGDLAAADIGEYGLISGDLPHYVAKAIKRITDK